MRAMITGASGFLGGHLSAALRARGDFVVDLVRDRILGLHWRQIDPSVLVHGQLADVERIIAEYEIDVVFHLAAQTQVSVALADPAGTLEANVRGTWTVLDACRRQGIERLVVASSDKSYGDGTVPYSEKQDLKSGGVYATSKTCADLIAQAYAREFGIPLAITRCGNLYGPGHMNWSTLIPGTIRSVLRGERPRLRSDGGPRRDFLYVEDAVDGYLRIADMRETGIFNFGCGVGVTVTEVVAEILRLMKTDLTPIPILQRGGGAVEIKNQVLDIQKAVDVLDWRPRHSLTAGLTKTIDWYRAHKGVLT